MESKICTQGKIEEHIGDFYNKYTECKRCSSKRSLNRYYGNKGNLSIQRKIFYEKNREKLLQKQDNRQIKYEEVLRSYVELENKLKVIEEKFKINDSENN